MIVSLNRIRLVHCYTLEHEHAHAPSIPALVTLAKLMITAQNPSLLISAHLVIPTVAIAASSSLHSGPAVGVVVRVYVGLALGIDGAALG